MENATQIGAALFVGGSLLGLFACALNLVLSAKPVAARVRLVRVQTVNAKALAASNA